MDGKPAYHLRQRGRQTSASIETVSLPAPMVWVVLDSPTPPQMQISEA